MRWVVAVACVTVLLGAWLYVRDDPKLSCVLSPGRAEAGRFSSPPLYARAGHQVAEVPFREISLAVAEEQPFVVRNARETLGWRAFDTWAPTQETRSGDTITRRLPSFLAESVDNVACQPNSSPYFTYFKEDRPISSLQSVQALKEGAPTVHSAVPTCDFIAAMHGELPYGNQNGSALKDCTSVYYSAPLHGETADVLSEVLPISHLIVQEQAVEDFFPEEMDAVKLMVWMGSNGTVTRMHYDWSHNFHAVLSGSKKFRMYPPHDSWKLELYPYLHPRATKSQLAFDSDGFSSGGLHPFDVSLSAGDILYIPPLWHHEVTSLQPTVSLAVWSPSAETLFVNEVLSLGLPFTQAMMRTPQARANALAVFLNMLVMGVEKFGLSSGDVRIGEETVSVSEQSFEAFMASLFQSRFARLRAAVPELFPTSPSFDCPSRAWVTKSQESFDLEQYFLEHVRDVFVPRFAFIPKQRRDIWVADFIETTANFVLGLPSVVPFLECIASWK